MARAGLIIDLATGGKCRLLFLKNPQGDCASKGPARLKASIEWSRFTVS